jgi:hypothetical protein
MATDDPPLESIADDIKRIADALDAAIPVLIELVTRLTPPPPAPRPLPVPTPIPAHELYLSGEWKRRDGAGLFGPRGPIDPGDPHKPIDPQLRRSPPAIDGEPPLGVPSPFDT